MELVLEVLVKCVAVDLKRKIDKEIIKGAHNRPIMAWKRRLFIGRRSYS
jgi:hypothetical protein